MKARTISQTTRMEISKDGTARYNVTGRVQILKESGRRYGEVSLDESQFVKIEKLTGRVYDAGGNLIGTRNKKDARRVCGFSEYAIYADNCEYQLDLGAGNYPFTIEYEYTLKISSLFFWPAWYPQSSIPVDTAKCTVTIPTGFSYKTSVKGDISEPVRSTTDKTETVTWTLTDIPAFETESYMPCKEQYLKYIRFSTGSFSFEKFSIDESSWSSASHSIFELMKPASRLSPQQAAVLDSIFPSHTVDANGCNRLHQFLSARSRYVAVSIGIGGWQPHPSDETFARGYGDCKDLSTMYVTMLRREGVLAKPALLMTKGRGRTDPEFPSLRFNHVIFFYLNGSDTVWVDPTCFACKTGDLPWQDEGVFALVIDSSSGSIVRTPESKAADNVIVRNASMSLNPDMSVNLEVRVRATGDAGSRIRTMAQYISTKEIATALKSDMNVISDLLQVTSCQIDTTDRDLSSFTFNLKGKLQAYARQVSRKTYLGITALPIVCDAERTNLLNRRYPIELQYPFTFVDTIRIIVPDGMRISEIPKEWTLDDPSGEFYITSHMDGESAMITRFRTAALAVIDTASIAGFANYRGKLYWANGQEITIEKR